MLRRTELERIDRFDVCRLVTNGRRTGRPHDIEMWFSLVGEAVCMISGNGPSADWYRNALADPWVKMRFGSDWFAGSARPAAQGEERRAVGEAMTRKYGGWGGDPEIGLAESDWTWRVPALIVEFDQTRSVRSGSTEITSGDGTERVPADDNGIAGSVRRNTVSPSWK